MSIFSALPNLPSICADPIVSTGRQLMYSFLRGMKKHSLRIEEKQGRHETVFGDRSAELKADMKIQNPRGFYTKLLLKTDVGFAEAFMSGDFDTTDLHALLLVLLTNREYVSDYVSWTGAVAKTLEYAWHYFWRAPSNYATSKKNVQEHYDLTGLFHHFLDETMCYSCGIFLKPDDGLYESSMNKIDSTIQQMRITSSEQRVLEIGAGWGTLAFEIAARHGCKVHGLTLSEEQLAYCQKKAKERGLQDLVTFELIDYRQHVTLELYDRIVSIEMLEAVGHAYLGKFFETCDRLLNKDGLVFVQVITMSDARYENYRTRPDFINTYIFPGGCCPSLTALAAAATANSSLQIETVSNIGPHYARTLELWSQKFLKAWPEIAKSGHYDEAFRRRWLMYFQYCRVAFETRTIGDLQILWTRSTNVNALPGLPQADIEAP